MQRLLLRLGKWADNVSMPWSINKSCGIALFGSLLRNGQLLTDKCGEVYLGFLIRSKGTTDGKLTSTHARYVIIRLRRLTHRWKLSAKQQWGFVKTFMLSICDYLLYLQPIAEKVSKMATELEHQCAEYILGVNISPRTISRALSIVLLLQCQRTQRNSATKMQLGNNKWIWPIEAIRKTV